MTKDWLNWGKVKLLMWLGNLAKQDTIYFQRTSHVPFSLEVIFFYAQNSTTVKFFPRNPQHRRKTFWCVSTELLECKWSSHGGAFCFSSNHTLDRDDSDSNPITRSNDCMPLVLAPDPNQKYIYDLGWFGLIPTQTKILSCEIRGLIPS